MESTPEHTDLSAAEYERQKDAEARVEDIAYTINHSIACTVTDWVDPIIGNWTQKYLGKRYGLPGGHSHGDHDHHHDHHDHSHGHHHGGGTFWQWAVGEIVGDYGAVPVTIAFQRWAPGFMNSLRFVLEPPLGPLFRNGARTAALSWAARRGIDPNAPEVKAREQDIYEHEVRHLPQALMWTASSVAINLATQRAMGNKGPLWQLATGKALGASITAGLVVGARGLAPESAEKWDHWTSKNVFLPLTERIGHLFGVKKEDVERMHRKKEAIERGEDWKERVVTQASGNRALG